MLTVVNGEKKGLVVFALWSGHELYFTAAHISVPYPEVYHLAWSDILANTLSPSSPIILGICL